MTAQEEEIESAMAEGIELMTLQAPIKIEKDEDGNFRGLPECDFDDLIIDEAQDFNKPGMDALWDAIISLDKSDTFRLFGINGG